MKQLIIKCFFIVFSIFTVTGIFAQDIPEEARRHLARGQAAVEIAKLPEDYNLVVTEFQQAIQLAPQWAEPYYQLGLVYEKTEKYADAISSLKKYIELAPDAENAGEVKSRIYKLEFKAEQVLTNSNITDVLCAKFQEWSYSGDTPVWPFWYVGGIEKTGENSIKIIGGYNANDGSIFASINVKLKVEGPKIKFSYYVNQCGGTDPCPYNITSEIEVISKTYVKYNQTINSAGKLVKYSGEFKKKE